MNLIRVTGSMITTQVASELVPYSHINTTRPAPREGGWGAGDQSPGPKSPRNVEKGPDTAQQIGRGLVSLGSRNSVCGSEHSRPL